MQSFIWTHHFIIVFSKNDSHLSTFSTQSINRLVCNSPSRPISSEPVVPGDEEEAAAASPEPEPEVEKEAEAAVVELKPETMLETQTDAHTTDDQTEKSPAAAPPTAEPAAVPAEPAPAAPEENRVGLNLTSCFYIAYTDQLDSM